MTSTATDLIVSAWPDGEPRLLRPSAGRGYRPLDDADALLEQVDLSGLLGRGGAAFPLGTKLRAVRDAARRGMQTVVVANGEEGEPASVKDRWLLRNRPHLVLDGLRLAARLAGAPHVHVYVSDLASARAVETALADAGTETLDGLTVSVRSVDPGYVAGEETAAVRAINGGPAKPTDKPPRPFEEGVGGLPTLVSNGETLANLPYIHRHGAPAYRASGTAASAGTFLATITGGGGIAGLYEVPFGVSFTELLALHGLPPEKVR